MRQRINLTLALALSLIVGASPVLTLASSRNPARATFPRKSDRVLLEPGRPKPISRRPSKNSGQPEGQSTTVLAGGRLLLIGGIGPDGQITPSTIFDPRNGERVLLADKSLSRAWHSATMLPDGRVLIVGGIGASGQVLESAGIFDSEKLAFEDLPNPAVTPRAYHSATLLTDGRVLIVGGVSAKGLQLSRAELWSFKTQISRTITGKLSAQRAKAKTTLLSDGNVLIEGGFDESGKEVRNSELFNSEAESFNFTTISSEPVDMNTPFLTGSLPRDGATDVELDSVVALRFSKPLQIERFKSETLKLTGGGEPINAKITLAESGRLAFILPMQPLQKGTTYTVTFSDGNDDTNRVTPAVFSFTTMGEKRDESNRGLPNQSLSDVDWVPNAENLRGNWRSKGEKSSWQDQPSLQANPGETALSGQVLTLRGQPLANVTISIDGHRTNTDSTGRFLLQDISSGHQVMVIDGRSASRPGATFGIFRAGVDLTPNQTNVLPYTIWMPKLDMAHAVSISSPTVKDIVITTPHIPGLELHLPAGTFIRDLDGRAVTQISITAIPTNQSPFPLPPGVHVPTFFTIQPGGAQVIPPRAYVIYPNFTSEPPGSRIYFWNYDPTGKGWYIYGQGTVSANGKQVIPDPGVVLYEFSGLMDQTSNPQAADKAPKPGNNPLFICRWLPFLCGSSASGGSSSPSGSSGPSGSPGPGYPSGRGPVADPVDPGTGLFVDQQTDLFLPDVLPLALTRTYRPEDSGARPFGIGATHPYAIFLSGGSLSQYQETNLILPDSGRIHFVRITPGTGYADAVFEHTETPTVFYKSRVTWNGNGWNLTLRDGTVFVFGENAPLQSIRDRNGNQITITWSAGTTGNITQVTSPNGRWIQFTYDPSNRISQAKDNSGRTVSYTYDASGRLWKVTDANGGITEYTYDSSHRMLTIKDARGILYLTNEYDIGGRVKKQTLADTHTYELAYTLDAAGNITQTDITDQRGNITRVTYGSAGFPVTDTEALGTPEQQTITYERQAGTNMISKLTDALNRSTTYTRDSDGYITEITRLAGTGEAVTSHFTYEPAFHRLATATDPLNHTTSFAYDAKGNLISIVDALSHQVSFSYNAAGQPLSVTDPLIHTTEFTYDNGDLVEVLDPLGRSVSQLIDGAGRVLSSTSSMGHTLRYEYDALGRLGRIIDPLQGATVPAYDPNGNLLSVTDARNGAVNYTNDNMDRVTSRRDALLHDATYQYNSDGTLQQVTDRKTQTTSFTYDPLNRLNQATFNDSSTITYTYDAGNRLTEVADSLSGSITYGYDNLDRLSNKTSPQGTISYTYDAASRLKTMTVTGQPTLNYTYDNANRLTEITKASSTVTIGYDNAGRRTLLMLPNGVTTEYEYDEASQLTGLIYKKGATVLGNLTYEYDSAGRRTKIGGSYSRVNLPQALTSATYNAANQQTAFGAQSLTYDLNGNLTSDGGNTYTWNARYQLVSITGPGITASFQYDALGNRISKTLNGATTTYFYDGANVVQEKTGGVPSANIIVGGLDEVFIRTDGMGTWSPLADGIGSTLALTDATGTVQTEYTYDPFGKTTVTGAATNNTSQYTGRENDGTGLYFNRGRYYSPSLQRFISEDPIGVHGGINLYAYVGNNPISFTDPFGLKPNNPGNDAEEQAQDVMKMLRGIVNDGKAGLEAVIFGAAFEGLGPILGSLELVKGSTYYAEIGSSQGKLGILADISLDGKILKLDDLAIYPTNAERLNLGTREMLAIRQQLMSEARALGFDEIQITGIRYQGANPGRVVNTVIRIR